MRIEVYNRQMAQSTMSEVTKEPHIWISITDPKSERAVVPHNKNCKGILRLRFHDVDLKRAIEYYTPDVMQELLDSGYVFFDKDHAQKIIDFVSQHKDDVELICVHCEAGISRSAGIAAAVGLWLNERDNWTSQPGFMPNIHVKTTILRLLMGAEGEQDGS